MFYSPSSLLLQTNLDRAHSCQPQLHLPLTPYTRKNLQNKTEFTSKPAPCRRHFSTQLTRKDVFSFFGNTSALALSKAFNTPFMQSFPSPLCNNNNNEMWGREVSLGWFTLAQPSKPSSRDLHLPEDHQASPPTPCLAAQMFPHLNLNP